MAFEHNIAYTNMKCSGVAKTVRRNMGKKDKYEVGEIMLCRLYKRDCDTVFNINFKYRITSIDNNEVVLQNIKSNARIEINIDILDKHLALLIVRHAIPRRAPR